MWLAIVVTISAMGFVTSTSTDFFDTKENCEKYGQEFSGKLAEADNVATFRCVEWKKEGE